MSRIQKVTTLAASVIALLAFAPACALDVNKSVRVDAGQTSTGESSVNGSISVGRDAVVDGKVETVNGSIRVDDNARIRQAETVNGTVRLGDGVSATAVSSVNGAIELGEGVTVDGEISVVNGRVRTGTGSRVAGDVSNVNGALDIEATEIGGNLSTVSGDVTLSGNSVLRGNLIVEKPESSFWRRNERRKPRIVVGPGVRVLGTIELEREVELFISDSAQVGGVSGVMSIDDAVRFSGDRP